MDRPRAAGSPPSPVPPIAWEGGARDPYRDEPGPHQKFEFHVYTPRSFVENAKAWKEEFERQIDSITTVIQGLRHPNTKGNRKERKRLEEVKKEIITRSEYKECCNIATGVRGWWTGAFDEDGTVSICIARDEFSIHRRK